MFLCCCRTRSANLEVELTSLMPTQRNEELAMPLPGPVLPLKQKRPQYDTPRPHIPFFNLCVAAKLRPKPIIWTDIAAADTAPTPKPHVPCFCVFSEEICKEVRSAGFLRLQEKHPFSDPQAHASAHGRAARRRARRIRAGPQPQRGRLRGLVALETDECLARARAMLQRTRPAPWPIWMHHTA